MAEVKDGTTKHLHRLFTSNDMAITDDRRQIQALHRSVAAITGKYKLLTGK